MQNLITLEHQNQRILTSQQLADAYEVETYTIRQNFNNNEERYTEGKHYYCLQGEELRAFKRNVENFYVAQNLNTLYLWTERGALLHAKSLNTDRAWEVYNILVDTYFTIQKPTAPMPPVIDSKFLFQMAETLAEKERIIDTQQAKIEQDKPKVVFADAVATSKTSILVGEMAKILKQNGVDMGQNRFYEWLRKNGYLISRQGCDRNMPTQYSMERGLFEIKETSITHSDGNITISKTPKVTGKGQVYFVNKFVRVA